MQLDSWTQRLVGAMGSLWDNIASLFQAFVR